jgi:oligopeptidase B
MIDILHKTIKRKYINKIKKRILNKTKKNIYKVISNNPEKFITKDELYKGFLYSSHNDILNLATYLKKNSERDFSNQNEILTEINDLKIKALSHIGISNINKIHKKLYKENLKSKNKVVFDIGIDYYLFKEKNKNYTDYKIKNSCNTYYLLDIENLSKQFEYFNVKHIDFNPSNSLMSFCVDFIGNRNYHFFIKDPYHQNIIKHIDLSEGKDKLVSLHDTMNNLPNKQLTNNYYWIDNESIIYITYNKYYNTTKCFTYNINTKRRRLIYNEKRHKMLGLSSTYSGFYYILSSSTYTNDEIYLLDVVEENLETHKKKVKLVSRPLFKEKEYVKYLYIDHIDATWYILKQDKDKFIFMKTFDFKVFEQIFTKRNISNIREVIYINNIFVFFIQSKDNFYIQLYNKCNKKLIKNNDMTNLCDINSSCVLEVMNIMQYQDKILFYSSSFINKHKLYELTIDKLCNVNIKKLNAEQPKNKNKNKYIEEVIYLKNNKIVITQLYKKGLKLKNCKCLLYGYGSYGDIYDSYYNSNNFLHLCDQGYLVIIAHISGDGKLGFKQYVNGIKFQKKNTFLDFIYIIEEYLFKNNITCKQKLAIWGRSAGGLLIGSVLNMKPDICELAILGVPFISPIITMSSDKNPLGFESHSEWGNPLKSANHDYIMSYSPYQNIKQCGNYPHMFIYSNLNDSLVPYKEPYMYYKKMINVDVYKNNKKDILLHIDDKFGHNQGSSNSDYLKTISTIFSVINKYIK